MRTMKQLREVVTKVLNMIKDEKLTVEETIYVLECVKYLGWYVKIRGEVDKLTDFLKGRVEEI